MTLIHPFNLLYAVHARAHCLALWSIDGYAWQLCAYDRAQGLIDAVDVPARKGFRPELDLKLNQWVWREDVKASPPVPSTAPTKTEAQANSTGD